ncbi:MAG: aminotransferase class III-fold pyridoxal phosphate-dependent enzyme [Anaerolineales bacterium]|nr:aminotransferase class III-fold pyridoxal phosphate-dependent enzyme [Anaerolineales bacterium]
MADQTKLVLSNLLMKNYGVEGAISPLPGENENYLVKTENGAKFVLKVTPPGYTEEWMSSEEQIVRKPGEYVPALDLPELVHTREGRPAAELGDDGTDERPLARLFSFVGGQSFAELTPLNQHDYAQLGASLGRLSLAFASIDVPGTVRTHDWDISQMAHLRSQTAYLENQEQRDIADRALILWSSAAQPYLDQLPQQLIHGDINDENILFEDRKLSGLLDFSDCLVNPAVCELAIALAYLLLDTPAPLQSGAEVVSGFHQARPLSQHELEVLFPLMVGRLAMSVLLSAQRRKLDLSRSAWFATEEKAWRALGLYVEIDPVEAADQLVEKIDMEVFIERGSDRTDLLGRRAARFSGALSLTYDEPIHFVRGRGAYLFDDRGRPYLDLYNNVPHVGHSHPRVVEAAHRQMSLLNTNTRYLFDPLYEYADRLGETLPESLQYCFFVNSGTEANELALRLARVHTCKEDLFILDHAYHGHTRQLIQISPYKFMGPGGTGKPEPWVHVLPIPDVYRGAYRKPEAAASVGEAAARLVASAGQKPAGFIAETLPSCAGQIIPPEGYFERVFRAVRSRGGVCILDEVQVGFGRVGTHFWAFERYGITPDILVLGKPIGNGHPLGAVVTTREVSESLHNAGMEFFSTFGGNPVSCAVGLAVLDVLEEEGLQANAARVGEVLLTGLRELQVEYPLIGDVRGAGLFIGMELVKDPATLEPAPVETDRLVNLLRQRRILTGIDGPYHNVIKIKPPMVLSEDDARWAVREVSEALKNVG